MKPAAKKAKTNGKAAAPKAAPKAAAGKATKAKAAASKKSKDPQVPLDEGCPLTTFVVYIDDKGVIWDASLNQTNASNNNNKFYRIQVGDPSLKLRWQQNWTVLINDATSVAPQWQQ